MAASTRPKIKGSVWEKRGRYVAQLPPSLGRRSETFDTEEQAWAWLAEQNVQPAEKLPKAVTGQDATVAAVAAAWLAGTPLKPTSRGNYAGAIKKYIDGQPLGLMPISEVLPHHINSALMALPQNWGVKRLAVVLGGLFNWAEANRLIVGNPVRASSATRIVATVRKANPPRTSVENVWSLEELGSFIRAEQDPVRKRLWIFTAATGARRGEALGLQWANVHAGWAWLWTNVADAAGVGPVVVDTPKSGMRRKAFYGPWVAGILQDQRESQEAYKQGFRVWTGDFVFDRRLMRRVQNVAGSHLSPQAITVAFNRLSEELGLPHLSGPHGLRRSLATLMSKEGFPHHVRAAVLGHASDVTDHYSKVSDQERRECAARIDELLRKAVEG
jgi:integrase